MKYIPSLKLFTNITRTMVFLLILYLSESKFGSVSLMSFISIATVIGISVSFGLIDSLVVCSNDVLNRFKRFSNYFYIFLLFLTILITLDIKILNNILCGIFLGCIYWSYGEIRRYSPIIFEIILSILMLSIWIIYLSFFYLESDTFIVLTIIFSIFSFSLFFIVILMRRYYQFTEKVGEVSGFVRTSISKQGWEISYSFLTRSPFIIWGSSGLIHPITTYIYFYCELLSAIFSHYQTIFVTSNNAKENKIKFHELFRLLLYGYSLLVFALVGCFIFQDILVEFLKFIRLPDQMTNLLLFDARILIFLIVMLLNIFTLQVFAYMRYSRKLHDDTNIIFFFAFISVTFLILSLLLLSSQIETGIIISNILLTIILLIILYLSRIYQNKIDN